MLVYPLSWPIVGGDLLRPSNEDWITENADTSGGVSATGSEQTVGSGSSRVRCTLTFQVQGARKLALRGLVAGLRGRSGRVLVPVFDLTGIPKPGATDFWAFDLGIIKPTASFPADLTTVAPGAIISTATAGATEIRIRMQPGRMPLVGNYLGMVQRLHFAIGVTAVSSTDFIVDIEPKLRDAKAIGDLVSFSEPVCLMRLAKPPDGLSTDVNLTTTTTLEFVEYL